MIEFVSENKLFIAVLGWIYSTYLSYRSGRRTEVSRLKDRLVDKVEKAGQWYVDSIKGAALDSMTEQILTNKVSQCETRLRQINTYVGCEICSVEIFKSLRDIDPSQYSANSRQFICDVHEIFASTIDKIEEGYDLHFVKSNFFAQLWRTQKDFLLGAVIALESIYFFFKYVSNLF